MHFLVVHLATSNLLVHFIEFIAHGEGVHAAHDGLARSTVKPNVVGGAVRILVVIERPFGDVEVLALIHLLAHIKQSSNNRLL